ncbi:hypothetical protein ACHAXS_014016 [Conticribra weissflogii]
MSQHQQPELRQQQQPKPTYGHHQRLDSQAFLVPVYFALWYALNVAYNITNKWALQNVQDMVSFVESSTEQDGINHQTLQQVNNGASHKPSALPVTIGCIQFLVGSIYACALWAMGFRRPVPHAQELLALIKFFRRQIKLTLSSVGQYFFGSLSSSSSSSSTASANATTTTATTPSTTPTTYGLPLKHTFHIAIHHTLGQLCTVLSLSSNSISFTHVIKAMEPLFSALASFLFLGQRMDVRVYLSLIPVVGGVVMACAGSREFSWVAFLAGMGSNAFFAVRGVVSKLAMEGSGDGGGGREKDLTKEIVAEELFDDDDNYKIRGNGKSPAHTEMDTFDCEDNMKDHPRSRTTDDVVSPANLFAAVTCISFFLSVPLVVVFEGNILQNLLRFQYSSWMANETTIKANDISDDKRNSSYSIIMYIITSGLFHYLNNEVMYLVLSNVHPVTLAVGNTMKRVFIIVAGIIVFSTPTTWQTALGSTIGIGGVFVYSLMKQWYDCGSGVRKEGRFRGQKRMIIEGKDGFVEERHLCDVVDGGDSAVEMKMLKEGLVHR